MGYNNDNFHLLAAFEDEKRVFKTPMPFLRNLWTSGSPISAKTIRKSQNITKKEVAMIRKQSICQHRIRKIQGSFTFIEHRFLRDGFFASLDQPERSIYLFLALASDRQGLSYYGYDKICNLNGMLLDDYIRARDGLIDKDLIAFDGTLFQVLSLPEKPCEIPKPLSGRLDAQQREPGAIDELIERALGGRS